MLSLCRNFQIFGDGGNRIILITINPDGEQEAFIMHNPMIKSLTTNVTAMTSRLELTVGKCEFHQGINLDKQFDPVWSKSVRELLSIIDNKLDERK